jgi:phosphoglycerate dehydrogenase-like enzyme
VKPKILVIAGIFQRSSQEARQPLLDAGFELVDAASAGPYTEDALIEALAGYDGVIAGMEPYTDRVFAALPQLKVVARWGVGVDAIDLEAASRHGRYIVNTPGVLVDAVADLAWMFIMALARRWRTADDRIRSGGWGEIEGVSVFGKTLGIVGLGAIGQAVARRARGFEMTIIGCDPMPNAAALEPLGVRVTGLEEVLSGGDFVTLHAKTTGENTNMIGEAQLRLMKPSAYLINTARGALVDQAALTRALQEGWIAGAGLDVLAKEPPDPSDPILSLPNCLLTPHCGSCTTETVQAVNAQVCRNVVEAFADPSAAPAPRFLVNPESWPSV